MLALGAACAAATLAAGLGACGRSRGETLLTGETMGSVWTVKIAGALPRPASEVRAAIQSRFDAVDAALSTWRADSALGRFNAHAGDDWQQPDPELFAVLQYALQLAAQSGGAYDVTLGPVVDLWGFGPAPRRTTAPSAADIEAALQSTGWQKITLDVPGQRARRPQGLRVDLSSLGKGRGVDRVAAYLLSQGMKDFLIDLSGKLRASGINSDGARWRVAVEQPGEDDPRGLPRTASEPVPLADEAIASAGTYRRYFEAEGRHYSHLIDAHTGSPLTHGTQSSTVIAADAMHADALATMLILMPPDAALQLANAQGLAALLLVKTEGGIEARETGAWRERAAKQRQGREGAHPT